MDTRPTDLCKLPLETCQIHYGTSVVCESNWYIFYMIFFSFATATSLVSEASKLLRVIWIKIWHLEVRCLWNSHFIKVHASVYERAFEFILRNVYIFKLPLVDDRNTIWFVWHHWRLTLLEKEISNFCP